MRRIKIMLAALGITMGLGLLVGGFSEKALADELLSPAGVTPFSTGSVREVSLENGESFTLRTLMYKDINKCMNYIYGVSTISGETEAFMIGRTRDDGTYDFAPSGIQAKSSTGTFSNYFENYMGIQWLNHTLTNLSGGRTTYRIFYNAKIVWNADALKDYDGLTDGLYVD